MIRDLVALDRNVEAEVGLSHLWTQGGECPVAWGTALSYYKVQSCGGWSARSKSCSVPGGKAGCFLSPLLQYVGSKSILRRADWPVSTAPGPSTLRFISASGSLGVATLGMPVLSRIELGSVGLRRQEGLSWNFSKI